MITRTLGIGMLLSLVMGGIAAGQSTSRPAYAPERWDEDWSFLQDPAHRSDPFDPIKYIPLSDDGDIWLSLGGQVRYRYEFWDDNNFDAGPQDDDGLHLLRLLAHADLHIGPNLRFFVEGKSAMEWDRTGGPRPVDEDQLDLQQAFADLTLSFDEHSLLIRVGRQDLIYGAQRLISPLDWANTRRTFDGLKLSWSSRAYSLDFFIVQPVLIDEDEFNERDDDTTFAGLYYVRPMPQWFGPESRSKIEAYLLGLYRDRGVDEDRYTVGTRFFTAPKPWDIDVELAWQFGEIDGDSISAWSVAAEIGYTFADCPLTPRLLLGFDAASGGDPTDRFDQLFPLGHAYFGFIDVIGRQNIIDLQPGISFTLRKDLSLRLRQHFFWRQDTDDAVYNAAGGVLRADSGSDARYIGSEFDLLLNWTISRHWSAYAGYSHFFPGDFIDETGPSQDIDFFYVAATFTF